MDPEQHETAFLVGHTDNRAELEAAVGPLDADVVEAFRSGDDGEIVIVRTAKLHADDLRARLGPNVETVESEEAAFEVARAAVDRRTHEV